MKNEPYLNIHAFIISITIFIVVDNVISSNSVTVSTYNITKHTVSRQISIMNRKVRCWAPRAASTASVLPEPFFQKIFLRLVI